MLTENLKAIQSDAKNTGVLRPACRVVSVDTNLIRLQGHKACAAIGDRVELKRVRGPTLAGEVIKLSENTIFMLPDVAAEDVSVGDMATIFSSADFLPSEMWIGRIIDPYGRPLDGRPLRSGAIPKNVHARPPAGAERRALGPRLETGMSVFNTFLPIVRGQRIGLFAGSGVGKSMLLANFATGMEADVVVVALIGERGREINEFAQRTLGQTGMERAVVIAATSDQPATVRRRCAWAAMAAAEFFRDQGLNVLFLGDSVTRFAEAHREVSATVGEVPSLRGFPPSVIPLLSSWCERAGPGSGRQGDITAVFSVLVAGSDQDEPIADILRGVLDGHVVLDREIAERGRFPAIDLMRSVSRSLPYAATDEENAVLGEVKSLLAAYEKSEIMVKSGLYQSGADPELDRAVQIWPELDQFLTRNKEQNLNASFDQLRLMLRRNAGKNGHTW